VAARSGKQRADQVKALTLLAACLALPVGAAVGISDGGDMSAGNLDA
jgi:hypothetical protein